MSPCRLAFLAGLLFLSLPLSLSPSLIPSTPTHPWHLPQLSLTLQAADFGPRTALKVVDTIRDGLRRGSIKTQDDIRSALRAAIVKVLTSPKGSSALSLGTSRPGVVLVVGVNGGGKTTTIGKLAHKLQGEDAKVRPSCWCSGAVPQEPAKEGWEKEFRIVQRHAAVWLLIQSAMLLLHPCLASLHPSCPALHFQPAI